MSAPRDLATIQGFLGETFRGMTPLGDRPDLHAAIAAIVAGNDRLTPAEQAEIYREQFWLRHRDVLRDDYPALRHLIGEESFDDLVRAYLEACPPRSYTLRDLGDRLAEFARSYDRFPPEHAAAARDRARFELAFVDIFDGADVPALGADEVAAIPADAWPTAKLGFHPLLTILRLDHPVHAYRTALKRAEREREDPERHPSPAAEPSRPIAAEATVVAMWRGDDLRVHYRTIAAHEADLLAALREGAALADALGALSARLDPEEAADFSGRLGLWFEGWGKRGWIVDVTT
ncbi:MAG: DNA-binding domain-containing protein [Polyangiaceae bacterium]